MTWNPFRRKGVPLAAAPQSRVQSLSARPPLYKWKSCPRCSKVQQIVLASRKPATCTSCGLHPLPP